MHPKLHKALRWLPIFLVIGIALFLRLYRFEKTIIFDVDQGMDASIIWYMEHMDHSPLVGPLLGLSNVYTPPTYYYVTWFFYRFTTSVTSIAYGYFILNMFTLLLLITLANDMAGRRTAVITGGLFAVSFLMIQHGRTFWQPYPMQFFLALSLLTLWHAYQKKNLLFLWLATLSFQLAISVYPSPVMLLPFVIYHLIRWYTTIAKQSIITSVCYSVITFFLTICIVFAPQIVFEFTHNFATLHTLISQRVDSVFSLTHHLSNIGLNIYNLSIGFMAADFLPGVWRHITTGIYIGILLLLSFTIRPEKRIVAFFAPLTLIAGLGFLIFYPYDISHHRMWTYLPFLFLYSSIIINQSLNSTRIHTILTIILVLAFITSNLNGARMFWTDDPHGDTGRAKAIVQYIKNDMDARNLTERNTAFFYKIPNDPLNGSYGVYRILYWLIKKRVLTLDVVPKGNMVAFNYSTPMYKRHMYILCYDFTSLDHAQSGCVNPVIGAASYKHTHHIRMYNTYVFLVERTDIPDLSGNSAVTPSVQ